MSLTVSVWACHGAWCCISMTSHKSRQGVACETASHERSELAGGEVLVGVYIVKPASFSLEHQGNVWLLKRLMHMNETKSVLTCHRSFFLLIKNICPTKPDALELDSVMFCLTLSMGSLPVNLILGSHENSIIPKVLLWYSFQCFRLNSIITVVLLSTCVSVLYTTYSLSLNYITVSWGIFSMSPPPHDVFYFYNSLLSFFPPLCLHNEPHDWVSWPPRDSHLQ